MVSDKVRPLLHKSLSCLLGWCFMQGLRCHFISMSGKSPTKLEVTSQHDLSCLLGRKASSQTSHDAAQLPLFCSSNFTEGKCVCTGDLQLTSQSEGWNTVPISQSSRNFLSCCWTAVQQSENFGRTEKKNAGQK